MPNLSYIVVSLHSNGHWTDFEWCKTERTAIDRARKRRDDDGKHSAVFACAHIVSFSQRRRADEGAS